MLTEDIVRNMEFHSRMSYKIAKYSNLVRCKRQWLTLFGIPWGPKRSHSMKK